MIHKWWSINRIPFIDYLYETLPYFRIEKRPTWKGKWKNNKRGKTFNQATTPKMHKCVMKRAMGTCWRDKNAIYRLKLFATWSKSDKVIWGVGNLLCCTFTIKHGLTELCPKFNQPIACLTRASLSFRYGYHKKNEKNYLCLAALGAGVPKIQAPWLYLRQVLNLWTSRPLTCHPPSIRKFSQIWQS